MHKAYHPDQCPKDYNHDEYCPYCDSFIPIVIDEEEFANYELTCPVCGERLMLCSLCHWDMEEEENPHDCDWCEAHGCFRQRMKK